MIGSLAIMPPGRTRAQRVMRCATDVTWSWFTPGSRSTASVARKIVARIGAVKIVPLRASTMTARTFASLKFRW